MSDHKRGTILYVVMIPTEESNITKSKLFTWVKIKENQTVCYRGYKLYADAHKYAKDREIKELICD